MSILQVNNGVHDFQNNPKIILSSESSDILKNLKGINNKYFFQSNSSLVKKLSTVKSDELTKILKCFLMEAVQENIITDPVKFLDQLANMLPCDKLQDALKNDFENPLNEAKGMFEEAKHYLQMNYGTTSPNIRSRISSVLDGIIVVIESLISAFGLGDFFKPADNEVLAEAKSNKIMILLSLFSTISATLLPVLGAATGGLIIGGTLLAIAALSIIWPFIKPKTTHLPTAENWTKQIQSEGFAAQGRKESLDEIADIIKLNRHPILVGPSRVGKSLTAKAFAKAVENGDYPELKGKVVFRINTSDLVGHKASLFGGGNNILKNISAEMGRHREDIILVLDEIHVACRNNEKIAEQLKTFLDEGGKFPHVIGITTEEEYEKHVKDNNAFALRFDKVQIENTNEVETLKILGDALLSAQSKPLIKEGALNRIYEKSLVPEDAPQPTTSLKLLKQCINRTVKVQKSPLQNKITEVSTKILSLRSQAAASRGRKKEARIEIAGLEKQISALKMELIEEQKELNKLFKSKDLLDRVTKETYLSVLKISAIAQNKLGPKDEKQLKLFLLLHGFLARSLEDYISEKSSKLGIKTFIDAELIDEIAKQPMKLNKNKKILGF